jgi:hypothetical protein
MRVLEQIRRFFAREPVCVHGRTTINRKCDPGKWIEGPAEFCVVTGTRLR